MDAFNIIAGLATIAALVLAVWLHLSTSRKEAVEREKATTYSHRLADLVSIINAAAQQGHLVANLADRDETSKKELKHLTIAQLATLSALQASAARLDAAGRSWEFGIPHNYLRVDHRPVPSEERLPSSDLTEA